MTKEITITKVENGFIIQSLDDLRMSTTLVCPANKEDLVHMVLQRFNLAGYFDTVKLIIEHKNVEPA